MHRLVEESHCPICFDDGRQIGTEQVYLGNEEIEVGVRQCARCKLVFSSPRLNAEGLHSLYNDVYSSSSKSAEYCSRAHGSAAEYRSIARLVRKYSRSGDTVLDVGCGEGNLLRILAEDALYRLMGLELSRPAAEIARSRGFDVLEGDIEHANIPRGLVHTITLTYVLEHLPNPVATLKAAAQIINPEGSIIIAVPNYNYLRFVYRGPLNYVLRGQKSSLLAGEHLFNYTPYSLRVLAEAAGLTAVEWDCAAPHPVGSLPIKILKSMAYIAARLLFRIGIHVGGIHAVLKKTAETRHEGLAN